MKYLLHAGLLFTAVACGNTVIIEAGSGGADASSSAGTGGGAVVGTVGSGSTSQTATTTISVVASSSSGGPDCFDAPDCQGCLCNEQPVGCQAYQQAIIDNIYCGMSCAADCADFCVNQQDLPPACDECVNVELTQADLDAFIAACQASSGCVTFANAIQQCN